MDRRGFLALVAISPFRGLWSMPTPTLPPPSRIAVSEVFYWVNPAEYTFRVTESPTYEIWFTGYQPGDEDRIIRQIRGLAHVSHPRLTRQVFGVAS